MKDFKDQTDIRDFAGSRLEFTLTGFGKVQTRFSDQPVDVIYATAFDRSGGNDLGPVAIFHRPLISQLKSWYDGRPITGTLVRRHVGDSRLRGQPPTWVLDDVEVG